MELPCWPAQNVVTPVERRKGGPIKETIVLGIALVILDNRAICVLTFPRQHAHKVHVGLCYYAPFPRPWIFLDSLLAFMAGVIK